MATSGKVILLQILMFLTATISFTPIIAASIEGLYLRCAVQMYSIVQRTVLVQ